jgi:hypothetical protein
LKNIIFSAFLLALMPGLFVLNAQELPKNYEDDHPFYSWDNNYLYKGKPSIELLYGQSTISLKNSGFNFPENGTINLKLGWHKENSLPRNKIVKYLSNFIHGSYSTSNIRLNNSTKGAPVTFIFGFGSANGYGYKLGRNSSLVLYNSGAMTWTRYDKGSESENSALYDKRDDFNRTFRFGTSAEGGIIIPVGSMLNLQLSYDRTIVFPRHMVWKHFGSILIEAAGQTLIDGFVHAIYKSTPFAAPVVSFILKNGLSYGLYELRREKMNWPFESTEPLVFDTYRFGFKFKF